MRLGLKDRRVLDAFTDGRPCDGHKLYTDGHTLDGNWMGGRNMAEWKDNLIVFHETGGRTGDQIHRALKKIMPKALFGGFNPGHHHPRFWIQKALKRHKKGALHRSLHVPMGRKIPLGTLKRASHAKGRLGRRARLAMTLRKLRRR